MSPDSVRHTCECMPHPDIWYDTPPSNCACVPSCEQRVGARYTLTCATHQSQASLPRSVCPTIACMGVTLEQSVTTWGGMVRHTWTSSVKISDSECDGVRQQSGGNAEEALAAWQGCQCEVSPAGKALETASWSHREGSGKAAGGIMYSASASLHFADEATLRCKRGAPTLYRRMRKTESHEGASKFEDSPSMRRPAAWRHRWRIPTEASEV